VCQKLVTVAIKEVVFHEPVHVGDVVSFFGSVKRFGRTSITVAIEVLATRLMTDKPEEVKVTQAELTFVAVDDKGEPVPVRRMELPGNP
jgi:acyl-CoA thioesterase YciA